MISGYGYWIPTANIWQVHVESAALSEVLLANLWYIALEIIDLSSNLTHFCLVHIAFSLIHTRDENRTSFVHPVLQNRTESKQGKHITFNFLLKCITHLTLFQPISSKSYFSLSITFSTSLFLSNS